MLDVARRALFVIPLLIVPAAVLTKCATAEEVPSSRLPQLVQRVFLWFPENTETVVAARSFTMPGDWGDEEDERNSFPSGLSLKEGVRAWAALEGLVELERGKYLRPLAGKTVVLALRGGRNFEPISAFGHHRSEGCAIIVFEKELGEAATRWVAMLRGEANKVRQIAGREVFVFPATRSMNRARWPKPWLGIYLVLLKPDTILCATSDQYLEELLTRVDAASPRRALSDDLPEWKHVNPNASVWMLRHVSGTKEDRSGDVARATVGVTWTMTDDRFRVVFIPKADMAKEVEQEARKRWIQEKLGVQPEVVRQPDGTVTISSTSEDLTESEQFWFSLALDNLAGIEDYRDGK